MYFISFNQVVDGKLPMNHQITYLLQDIFNLVPDLTCESFVKSINVNTNDQMLVIYAASLIRSIIALHNLINNKLSNKEAEKKEGSSAAAKKDDKKAASDASKKEEANNKKDEKAKKWNRRKLLKPNCVCFSFLFGENIIEIRLKKVYKVSSCFKGGFECYESFDLNVCQQLTSWSMSSCAWSKYLWFSFLWSNLQNRVEKCLEGNGVAQTKIYVLSFVKSHGI